MRKTLNGILLGMILFYPAFLGYAGQEPATPGQDQQEKKGGTEPKGVAPRASATSYAAHAELEGLAIGATLLKPGDVRDAFTTDLNRCCTVVEVGLYPEKGKPAEITREDFALRFVGTDVATKPAGPQLLALTLQLASPGTRDAGVHGSVGAGVTYGSGDYDPVTGQRRGRGIGTSAEMDTEVSVAGSSTKLTPLDREFMELQLTTKGLPEGTVSAPVAGYLYFPLSTKKKKKAARQFEFTLAGQKVVLPLR